MSNSLRQQLLKAGIVNEKQLKKASIGKSLKGKKAKHPAQESQASILAKQALAEKTRQDKQRNQKREEKAQRKARQSQIKELIDKNRPFLADGEISYQFVDETKIKRIYVNNSVLKQLHSGQLLVIKVFNKYEITPKDVALKIIERDERVLIIKNQSRENDQDDDPYAEYKVPDDLIW